MMQIEIQTVGDQNFIRRFNRYIEDMRDFTEPFNRIYDDFVEVEKNIFGSEGAPERFVQLSDRYKEWKERFFPGLPIMQLHRRLVTSLISRNDSDAIVDIDGRGGVATFGTKIPYAHRHQMGTFGMKQRKFIQLTEEIKRRWAKIIQEWAFEQGHKAMGVQ